MKQVPLSQVLPSQVGSVVHQTGSRACKHAGWVVSAFPEVQPKCFSILDLTPTCWYYLWSTQFFSGSLHLDSSHSHMKEKDGFIDCFIPFHFNVVNSKSEILFLLKASAGPRNRCVLVFPSKERLWHGSLSRNIAWYISLNGEHLSLLPGCFSHNTLEHGYPACRRPSSVLCLSYF